MPPRSAVQSDTAQKKLPRIIYHPLEDGDPASTVWNRHRFEANVPTELRDIRGGHTAAEMLKLARSNKYFEIEGEGRKAVSAQETPTTSEQYRAHAARWIRDAKSVTQLVSRWESEKELREDCDIGTDDHEYLAGLFNPRKSDLVKAEKADAAMVEG